MTKISKKLKSVMLLDDNLATNFLHKKFLEKSECAEQILEFRSGTNALNYLAQEGIQQPDLLLVDINMPTMNAWEFLEKYGEQTKEGSGTAVILLSTSLSPADKEKADGIPIIKEILLKPLTIDAIKRVIKTYY